MESTYTSRRTACKDALAFAGIATRFRKYAARAVRHGWQEEAADMARASEFAAGLAGSAKNALIMLADSELSAREQEAIAAVDGAEYAASAAMMIALGAIPARG